jgi:hypothetical protein
MTKQGAVLRQMWRERYVSLLKVIFEEHESAEILIMPDEAMQIMEEILGTMIGTESDDKPSGLRFDFAAFRREAHHYAVDQFYKTYYGGRKGSPPLSINYMSHVLQLRKQGLNNSQIAKKLGKNKDAIRKQVQAAHRLLDKKVRNIRELSNRKVPPRTN